MFFFRENYGAINKCICLFEDEFNVVEISGVMENCYAYTCIDKKKTR